MNKPGRVERFRAVWDVASMVVEEAVIAAEHMPEFSRGDQRKAFVKGQVVRFVRDIEDSKDWVPDWAEGILFKGVEFAADWIIERVFRGADQKGMVNIRIPV